MKHIKSIILTLLTAILALPSSLNAQDSNSMRILYEQNFESITKVEETGWTFGGQSMSIVSDAYGKFIEFSLGQSNGRSANLTWGQEIFLENGNSGNNLLRYGKYKIEYEFCIKEGSNNQYNSSMTVFTNHTPPANQPYRNPWSPAGYWQNYLFDMSQVNGESLKYAINGGTIRTVNEDGSESYSIDYNNPSTLEENSWYKVTLDVNVKDRTVDYSVKTMDDAIIKRGLLNVPQTDVNGEEISMYAEGLHVMLARFRSTYCIDNIKIFTELSEDYANAPTIGLFSIGQTSDGLLNLNARRYAISFQKGETLHLVGTNGEETVVEYADCDGKWIYETDKSGLLKAWTTFGTASSEVVEMYVECIPVVLPDASATIMSVSEGFGKTYTLSVDNTEVPLRPTIFLNYEFIGINGENIKEEEVASGVNLTVTQPGTLTITTEAYGYESKTVTILNNSEYGVKKEWDFARMTEDDIKNAGFPSFSILNSPYTTGFTNWTARKRLYYYLSGSEHMDDEGNIVYDAIYPFGFISVDNTTNVIKYSVIENESKVGEDAVRDEIFEGLTIFPKKRNDGHPNVGIMYRIGLYNDQTINNYNSIIVHDLDEGDFVVLNQISSYGANSNHPVVSNDEEYYAALAGENVIYKVNDYGVLDEQTGKYDVDCSLYRIDTACTKITVFKYLNTISIEGLNPGENFAYDGIWYTVKDAQTCMTRPSTEDFGGNVASGNLLIPTTVSYGSNEYTVTEIGELSFWRNPTLLSVSLPSTVEKVGSRAFEDCGSLTSLIWRGDRRMPGNVHDAIANPNLLVYVDDAQYAPEGLDHNVVANGICQKLVLTPGYPFTPVNDFTARSSSMTKDFTQITGTDGCSGWETIVLPFDVVKVTSPQGHTLLPFNKVSDVNRQRPFWLYEADPTGEWLAADSIAAGVPYIISMPNNPRYNPAYNISGPVTFSNPKPQLITAETTAPYVSTWTSGREFRSLWLPLDDSEAAKAMGLNVGIDYLTDNDGTLLPPGSAFHTAITPKPLEAYVVSNDNAKAFRIWGSQ
ncbi:MAG: leucine-rich repeat domain-containing protein, partial [Muribaculaceae bacterium]|nr:leucine-rich repeat domain-containing protein [Muribaculaceae bacterium]